MLASTSDPSDEPWVSRNIVYETGFVYVATGESYLREAAASASTLRRFHPTARICVVTDRAQGERFWDDLVVLGQPRFSFRDKLEMVRAPYARCVFLDTDTTICGDISQLFEVLTRYDLCGVQISEGQDYTMDGGVPHAFPEMNSGMIGFGAGPATEEFFALWGRFYDDFRALNRDGYYHYANVGDQKSLRAALWHSRVRHACVGGEFNFIPFRMELASLPVAVLHTRANTGLGPLAARLNARLGRRVYVPALDVVIASDVSTQELRRLVIAGCRQLMRRALRRLVPGTLRSLLRRSAILRAWFIGDRYQSSHTGNETKWEVPEHKS